MDTTTDALLGGEHLSDEAEAMYAAFRRIPRGARMWEQVTTGPPPAVGDVVQRDGEGWRVWWVQQGAGDLWGIYFVEECA